MKTSCISFSPSPAVRQWTEWEGAVVPGCYCKVLEPGDPRLVGIYYRTVSVTRCIVRLEWMDGAVWVRDAVDAPWHVHASGADSSRDWANMVTEKFAREWRSDELRKDLVGVA